MIYLGSFTEELERKQMMKTTIHCSIYKEMGMHRDSPGLGGAIGEKIWLRFLN